MPSRTCFALLDCIAGVSWAEHGHFAVPLDRQVAKTVLPVLKRAGCTVSLDVGWQPEWYLNPENLRTCAEADYFLPNRKEAEYLTVQDHPEDVLLGLEELRFTHMAIEYARIVERISPDAWLINFTNPAG